MSYVCQSPPQLKEDRMHDWKLPRVASVVYVPGTLSTYFLSNYQHQEIYPAWEATYLLRTVTSTTGLPLSALPVELDLDDPLFDRSDYSTYELTKSPHSSITHSNMDESL
jgi:hypothetical protein